MRKQIFICILTILIVSSAQAGVTVIELTLPEFSSPYHETGTYYDDYLVGTYNFSVYGPSIVSATITGQWGNSLSGSTAHNEMWLDGVKLADTHDYTPDPYWYGGPWSYVFAPAEFPVLADGIAELHTIQTSEYYVRLGETTLRIETIPAPGAILLGGIGAAFVGWLRRRRTL